MNKLMDSWSEAHFYESYMKMMVLQTYFKIYLIMYTLFPGIDSYKRKHFQVGVSLPSFLVYIISFSVNYKWNAERKYLT